MSRSSVRRTSMHLSWPVLAATAFSLTIVAAQTEASSPLPLLAMTRQSYKRLVPSSPQVTVSPDPSHAGIDVSIQPGTESYPGVSLKPEGAAWNLASYGHVEARVVNTGPGDLSVALRVDNSGDWRNNPWDAEGLYLKPGASGVLKVIFGYSYGFKPAYALDPHRVANLLLLANKAAAPQSFRIESLQAAGPAGEKPPVDPASIRIRPASGILFGPGVPVATATQFRSSGAVMSLVGANRQRAVRAVFPGSQAEQTASFLPTEGRWDLRDCLEVRVRLRNAGRSSVLPRARVESNGGPTDWVSAAAPITPGATAEVVVPFISRVVWDGTPGSGNQLTNDACSAVTVSSGPSAAERVLDVESIRADAPPSPAMPSWLGKHPPAAGTWVKTFDDEFNGTHVDAAKWNVTGENYYDKVSHYSRNNVIVGGGMVRLRYEKKTGFHNDDPRRNETPYATGFLDTYGKWTQRYGYFEARMKLPSAPGLWPAFWMMPDRGVASGPQWKRQDTANGGMEFDIMEHLTRWGPFRYNIAMHYDGYGKDHKATGSDRVYVQPDREGFITCGLLWLPGSATYYCNGRKVLEWKNSRISSVPSDIMFTLPSGGWDNNSLVDARLPSDFVVDYVRCWQLAASPVGHVVRPVVQRN